MSGDENKRTTELSEVPTIDGEFVYVPRGEERNATRYSALSKCITI